MSPFQKRLGFYLARAVPILVVGAFLGTMVLVAIQAVEPLLAPLRLLQGEARAVAEGVFVGPYPHERDLVVLMHRLGVTEVVSLLHPKLPAEARLIEEERRLAAQLGLAFRNVPISYLAGGAPDTQERLRQLAADVRRRAAPGRAVYVHCYLGRHRVRWFERALVDLPPPGRKEGSS